MTFTVLSHTGPKLASQVVPYPKAQGYGALIGDTWVRLAPNQQQPVRFYTKDSLAQRQDDRGSVYENVLDLGYAWVRGDLSGGEGLDYDPRLISQLDDSEARDRIRFWDSSNLDIRRPVRGESFRVTLSHANELWKTHAELADLATSDDYIFYAFGTTVEWYTSWSAGAPSGSATFSAAVSKVVATPAGDLAALLVDNTIEYLPLGGVVTPVTGSANSQDIWYVKGRYVTAIEVSEDGSLYEFDVAGVYSNPFDTYRGKCHSVVDSGPAVVAAMSDGTMRSYVPEQANQLDPSSVNLVIRGRIEVPEGEVPILLGSNAGILLILTQASTQAATSTIRLYQAEVLDSRFDYIVGGMQLRREWEDTYETPDIRSNMATSRDEIWFTVEEDNVSTATWRLDVVTLGLSRHFVIDEPDVTSIVLFDNAAGFISGTDAFNTNDDYQPEGWLISPNITFGLSTSINWTALVLNAQNLVSGGAQVELYYSTDPEAILDEAHVSWQLGIRLSSPGEDSVDTFLSQIQSTQMALMLRLYSSENDTITPNVSQFSVRGLPAHRDWILELPVNVSDYIEVPQRYPQHIQGYGETLHSALLSKVGDSLEVIVLDPSFAFRGIIDNIIEPTEYISDRGSASVRCVLQCRGERITSTALPTGNAGLGMGLLGVATLGVGQSEGT